MNETYVMLFNTKSFVGNADHDTRQVPVELEVLKHSIVDRTNFKSNVTLLMKVLVNHLRLQFLLAESGAW